MERDRWREKERKEKALARTYAQSSSGLRSGLRNRRKKEFEWRAADVTGQSRWQRSARIVRQAATSRRLATARGSWKIGKKWHPRRRRTMKCRNSSRWANSSAWDFTRSRRRSARATSRWWKWPPTSSPNPRYAVILVELASRGRRRARSHQEIVFFLRFGKCLLPFPGVATQNNDEPIDCACPARFIGSFGCNCYYISLLIGLSRARGQRRMSE